MTIQKITEDHFKITRDRAEAWSALPPFHEMCGRTVVPSFVKYDDGDNGIASEAEAWDGGTEPDYFKQEMKAGREAVESLITEKFFVHNDGKQRSQSFEAFTEVCDERGFGETADEAIAEHLLILSKRRNEIETVIRAHFLNVHKIVPVAWDGKPI